MLENATGKYIKELRTAQNLTQKELAEKIFVTNSAVSKWERGLGCPEIQTLPMLAAALETTVEELIQGGPNPSAENTPEEIVLEEKPPLPSTTGLKVKRGKVFFFTASILSTAFFMVIILINTVLNLDAGLLSVLDIVQPLTVAWLAATSIIGFIPWLFFYLMDRYQPTAE